MEEETFEEMCGEGADEDLKIWECPWTRYFDKYHRRLKSIPIKHTYSAVLGQPRCGKSYLVKYLYLTYWHKLFDQVIFFSQSERATGDFGEMVNHVNQKLYQGKRMDMALGWDQGRHMHTMDKLNKKRKEEGLPPYHCMYILDDITSSQHNSKDIETAFTMGRHFSRSIFLLTQKLTLIPTPARACFTYFFIGKPSGNAEELKSIMKELLKLRWTQTFESGVKGAPEGMKMGEFALNRAINTWVIKNTQKFWFLVVDQEKDGQCNLYKEIFRYKAEPFRM